MIPGFSKGFKGFQEDVHRFQETCRRVSAEFQTGFRRLPKRFRLQEDFMFEYQRHSKRFLRRGVSEGLLSTMKIKGGFSGNQGSSKRRKIVPWGFQEENFVGFWEINGNFT